MSKNFLLLYLMCFHIVAHTMDKKDEGSKSLSLFECFNQSKKDKLSQDFLKCLSASSDAQSVICSHLYCDKQYWYVDKQIEDVRLVSFDPAGKYFAAGYKDNSVKLFNAAVDKIKYELPIHSGELKILKFNPTGSYLVTGCTDRTVRVFEIASGQLLWALNDEYKGWGVGFCALEFDSIGDRLAINCLNEAVKIVESGSGKLVRELPYQVDHISFDPTNKYKAVIVGKDISLIERETEKERWKETSLFLFHSSIFDPTGKYLAVVSQNEHTVQVHNISPAILLCTLPIDRNICSIAFDPTGEYLVIGSDTGWGAVQIFQISLERLAKATSHCDTVESASCVFVREDFIKKLKDEVPSGKLVHLIPHNDTVLSVSFHPTGKYLATGCESLGARILTQYHQWTLQQKLLLKMLSTWLCIERPVSKQSFNELLHDVSSKFGCDLVDLQNILKTFPEKMVSSIWEKMKYMIKVYGKKMQQIRERMKEGNKRSRIAVDEGKK